MTTIIIVIAAIAIMLLLIHILMGNEMKIERNISIGLPTDKVFGYLKITKNQDYFSIWNMTDPDMKKEYHGIDGQKGFVYKWDSIKNKNVGAGEQEITNIVEDKCIEYQVRFSRPMKNIANIRFVLDPADKNETLVKWEFSGPTKFPMSLMKPVFQKLLGKDLENGLKNLKSVLEK
jgi:hypothetical protein